MEPSVAISPSPRSRASDAQPAAPVLDEVRQVFWQAYRHLFPPHAMAYQNDTGSILISWSMSDDPHATNPYAAPVMLRFEPELIELMWASDSQHRQRLAGIQEQYLRTGLVGYDPYAMPQKARIVVLG